MRRLTRALLLAVLACLPAGTTAADDSFRIVGYAPEWTLGKLNVATLAHVTDLLMFSCQVTEEGAFPQVPLNPESLIWYQKAREFHALRLHLCVGGWGRSDGFATMTANPDKRAAFVADAAAYCAANGLHGIDYDWEFPANRAEESAYALLLEETAAHFHARGLEVSVALGWTQSLDPRGYAAVDRIHLMTYDMGRKHATFRAMEGVVRRFLKEGVPASKLCLGVPFYGRRMDDNNVSAGYATLAAAHPLTPDTDEAGGFYFNGPETLRAKTRFARQQGLGGMMIWELSTDLTGEGSLLRAIAHEAASPEPSAPKE